jgi:D-alanyl-D-alanine carboxypeptidase
MTLHHLLRHQSGLPRYIGDREFWKTLLAHPDKVWKPEELLRYVFDAEPLFEAGDGWEYSDTNYIIAGMILEKVTGTTMYDYVRKHFLEPHGLRDTFPSDHRKLEGLVQGYTTVFRPFGMEERVLDDGVLVINPQFEWCGGGFVNTPLDLARWARILFSGKAFDGDYLEVALDAVPARQLGPATSYGIGVMIRDTQVGKMIGHDGVFPGYNSTMGYFPEHRIAAAFQMNRDGQQAAHQPMSRLLADYAAIAIDVLENDR